MNIPLLSKDTMAFLMSQANKVMTPEAQEQIQHKAICAQMIQEIPRWAIKEQVEKFEEEHGEAYKGAECPHSAKYNIYLDLDCGLLSFHHNDFTELTRWVNEEGIGNEEFSIKQKIRKGIKIIFTCLSDKVSKSPPTGFKSNIFILGRKSYEEDGLDTFDFLTWKSMLGFSDLTKKKMDEAVKNGATGYGVI
jgi:hypothetical protein